MRSHFTIALLTALSVALVHGSPALSNHHLGISRHRRAPSNMLPSLPALFKASADAAAARCFPSASFQMPSSPPSELNNWWCDPKTEYAFLGFSYEVTMCQSKTQLQKEFKDIRNQFHGRYVRLYGACDRQGFYDDIIDAAWDSGLGVHALIWFGFDGGDIWKTRRDTLFATLQSNPKAKFVTRVVQFGSEPLYDNVLTPEELTAEVKAAKTKLASLQIPVTISEMAYGFQSHGGAQTLMDELDFLDIHMLPFFSQKASTAKDAWPIVAEDLKWFTDRAKGKRIVLSQNGWPSMSYDGVRPNSQAAVADVQNEHDYYTLLDEHCSDFKAVLGGGSGWFAHLYSDSQEPGYGIYDDSMTLKFPFAPKTSC